MNEGLSGNIAKMFIQSKLTILLMIAFLWVTSIFWGATGLGE